MAESNVPVMQSVRAAYAFWRHYTRPAAGALALLALCTAVQAYANYTGQRSLNVLFLVFSILASMVAMGALYRLAFADERPDDPAFVPGPGGLQWGRIETRLLRVQALIFLFMVIAAVVFIFLVGIATLLLLGSAMGADSSPEDLAQVLAASPGGFLIVLLILILVLALLYSVVRLTLAQPATVDLGKVMVFETWPLTRGQFWPILGAFLLVSAPTILAAMVVGAVAGDLAEGASVSERVLPPGPAAGLAILTALVSAFLQTPLTVGLVAYLYRGLRPTAPAAATTHAP